MATFNLPTGGHVKTFPTPQRTGVEFVTYNAEGDAISTVRKSRTNALPMLASLRRADALACRIKSPV
ncbi:hypothetical protein [Streptomyces sp. NPDC051662]|uniref:hypothetical protein n=1 Tax=Streptomyces sp. NPDC051662 TaxID=3154750 RepID=UPI00342B189A